MSRTDISTPPIAGGYPCTSCTSRSRRSDTARALSSRPGEAARFRRPGTEVVQVGRRPRRMNLGEPLAHAVEREAGEVVVPGRGEEEPGSPLPCERLEIREVVGEI